MKKPIKICLVTLCSLGIFTDTNAQILQPFYKFVSCEIKNDKGDIIQYGNNCEFGNKVCIPNPCDRGFSE